MAERERDGRLGRVLGDEGVAILMNPNSRGLGREVVRWVDALIATGMEPEEIREGILTFILKRVPLPVRKVISGVRGPEDRSPLPSAIRGLEVDPSHPDADEVNMWLPRLRTLTTTISEAFRIVESAHDPLVGRYLEAIRDERELPVTWSTLKSHLRSKRLKRTADSVGRPPRGFLLRLRRLVGECHPSRDEIRRAVSILQELDRP